MAPQRQRQRQQQQQRHVRRPLSSRKLDMLYLVFFTIHIPIMLLVDLGPLWPSTLRPQISRTLHDHMAATYNDKFFADPPAWFTWYLYIEALYHLPLSMWMMWAIPKDHVMLPLHLLLFGVETGITTLTCIADMGSWTGYTTKQKNDLYGLYVPYIGLAVLIGVDAFVRVRNQILNGAGAGAGASLQAGADKGKKA
ncbi:hypothetical protein PV08_00175 [Exophiala spinifera]|uniref:EXPERA domain-containing protein n=1 Tax=Exophiala spinifera TaxID=91928 RepID=A0A0D2A423_9EURO|nr:uncharacterized protein PV08_00175 [Exophiala spinifera]KIW19602.1 hypothetical protein PV08_00175 [Exophiala spinifera]